MSDNLNPSEIAALVAKTLELKVSRAGNFWWANDDDEDLILAANGGNVFNAYWFLRCTLSLLGNGYLHFGPECSSWEDRSDTKNYFTLYCVPAEFPARAVAQIMSERGE